jgi:hypothetical protein
MLMWSEFTSQAPVLAEACRSLIYQYGVGLAFLGTVRSDGGPRVHPMCPLINDRGLFAFLIPSPKRDDLHRDARYVLHSFPADANEDVVYLRGIAAVVVNGYLRQQVAHQFLSERNMTEGQVDFDPQELFEFGIERCLHTVSTGHGDPDPAHTVWRADPKEDGSITG